MIKVLGVANAHTELWATRREDLCGGVVLAPGSVPLPGEAQRGGSSQLGPGRAKLSPYLDVS